VQVEFDCRNHQLCGDTESPHWLKSARLVENSSLVVSSAGCGCRIGDETESMTFVIAGPGNRVAGAGGES
jgi:hypothetical protein